MEQLEKIMKYLDGEVIGEEKSNFEKELALNVSLRKKLELVKEVDKTLKDEELSSFVSKIQNISTSLKNSNTEGKKANALTIRRYLSTAAVLLILAISSVLYLNLSGPKNVKIYNRYYQRYEASIITRSGGSETDNLITAIQLYDKGKYQEAISKFNLLLKQDNTNTTVLFFIGMSYMETKLYDKAIANFNLLINQKDTAFKEHAEWYMALCFIRTNQISHASEALNHIAGSNSFYKIKAVDLLKKL